MKSHGWISAGVAASVILIAAALTIGQLPAGAPSKAALDAGQATGSTSASTPAPGASAPRASSAPHSTTPAPAPPRSAVKRTTTEVLAPGTEAASALPPSTPFPSPVVAPLPVTASAVGSVVKGFPAQVIPTVPHSTVANSSVASEGAHLQVTLVAKSTEAVVDLMAFYQTALAKYGLYSSAAPALGGATATTFSRGADSVTVSATPGTKGTSYVIYGVFSVG